MKPHHLPPFLFFLILLTILTSCSRPSSRLDSRNWLLGEWESVDGDARGLEIWQQTDDSTFTGRAVSVIVTDTVWAEDMWLQERNGTIDFISQDASQNEGGKVAFRLVNDDPKDLIFENLQHDFPQRIRYTLIRPDSLVAQISSVVDTTKRKLFPMKRVKSE